MWKKAMYLTGGWFDYFLSWLRGRLKGESPLCSNIFYNARIEWLNFKNTWLKILILDILFGMVGGKVLYYNDLFFLSPVFIVENSKTNMVYKMVYVDHIFILNHQARKEKTIDTVNKFSQVHKLSCSCYKKILYYNVCLSYKHSW